MKTLQQIYDGYKSECLDSRDLHRLVMFVPKEDAHKIGVEFKKSAKHVPIEFTKENVIKQLKNDVEFGFVKALNKRGISASLMYEVVMMWNWILEDGLENWDIHINYAQYGLPLFKATAIKYGFNNPIGDDKGNEFKYSSDAD
jgi:hypothetical protein